MISTIEQAVKPHDRYQVEVKLDYELSQDKKTCYQVATYIFVPRNLGIHQDSYSKTDFYRDIQNYIRLKTPTLILRDFTENTVSPLLAVERMVETPGWTTRPDYKERLVQDLKLLSAMLKSAIREHFILIGRRIDEAPPDSKVHLLIQNLVEEFLVETDRITRKYRSFFAAFNLPNVDEQVFAAYRYTDESISLLVEESLVEMFQVVEEHLKKSERGDYKQKLSERAAAETQHRRSHGYTSILKENDDNEDYTFRLSVLKKYASSALFLSTAVQREGTTLEHVLYSLAAGVSMVFATVVAFYFQQRYGNFTFSFFAALVIGYMFKDRIKEFGRDFFSNYLENSLYDRRILIRTLDGKHKLGILREKVTFIREDEVPRAIRAARNKDPFVELDNSDQGETVIRYSKQITLFTRAFQGIFADMPEITGINDITRYDIRAYLRKMDEPVQERCYLQAGELKTVPSHKVYHLNLVTRYKSTCLGKEKVYRRIRLVLHRKGIKRLEHMEV